MTATRAGRGADQFGKRLGDVGFRRRAAVADGVGGIADERQHALVAERREPRRVGRRAKERRRIDLPVAGMQHDAGRRADRERVRFRNRMRDVDEFDRERAERQMPAKRHDVDRNLRRAGLGQPLGLEQGGRERRGVERHVEPRPQIDQRAHMILVAVGEDQADDVFALLDQIADVRQDEIDAGQMLLGRERHAAIDDEPLPAPPVAEAVDREIHPDLADAAERREDKFVLRHRLSPPAGTRRPPRGSREKRRLPLFFRCRRRRSSQDEPAGSVEPDEAAVLFAAAVAHRDLARRCRPQRASQSPRMAANPSPRSHCAKRRHMVADSRWNNRGGVNVGAVGGKIGRRIGRVRRMTRAIDADADDHDDAVARLDFAFDQNAGAFLAGEQHIVRPFERKLRRKRRAPRRRWHRATPRRRQRRVPARARRAPDRAEEGSHKDCPAATPTSGPSGRGLRSASRAVIHSGPRSPRCARLRASSLVEPIVARPQAARPPRPLVGSSCIRTANVRPRSPRRPAAPDRGRTEC